MQEYLAQIETLRKAFSTFELNLVSREQIEKADRLAQLASNPKLGYREWYDRVGDNMSVLFKSGWSRVSLSSEFRGMVGTLSLRI